MNFLKRRKKTLILFSLSLVLLLWVIPGSVYAAAPLIGVAVLGFLKVVATTASKIYLSVLAILYFIGYLVAALFSLGAYLVDLALKMNSLILKSPVLLNGWEMTLNFANLGLVLGIIIIAFATIFRVQNYAMKQILWKLIVVALLVNFSLVIAGALISVSDIISSYFLSKVSVTGNFADNLAAVMNPQKFLTIEETKGFWATTAEEIKSIFSASDVVKSAGSLFFVIIFTFLGALTFLSLAIMLFIRYVALIILLILSPLVWLFWIFPATSSHWNKWWSEFIRWTFFAPAVLFFLILVFEGMELYKKQILDASALSSAGSAIGQIIITQNAAAVIGQMVIFIALMFGGIYTANKMGITFAETSIKWAKGAGSWFGGWVGRKGLQYGTGVLRYKKAEPDSKSLAEHAQNWASKRTTRLGKFGAGLIATGAAKLSALGGEDQIKKAEDRTRGMTPLQRKAAILTADVPTRIAILKTMGDKKELKGIDAGIYKNEKTENEFARFSQQNTYKEVNHASGLGNRQMYEAAKKYDAVNPGSAESVAALTALREATNKYIKSSKLSDINKGDWNALYSEHDEKNPVFKLDKKTRELLGKDMAHGFAENLPGAFNRTTPSIEGKNMDNYIKTTREQIRILKTENEEKGTEAEKSFERNIGWFSLGTTSEVPSTPSAPSTSPSAP